MKKVFKLNKGKHNSTVEWKLRGEGLICEMGLREYFDVPRKATTLYVTISDEPSEESYQVETEAWHGMITVLKLNIPERTKVWQVSTYTRLDMFLEKKGLRNFYVKIDYVCD